jgi:dihydropteroate synthase
MGIVNVTPDSFSDGGRFLDPSAAVAHGLRLVAEGADLVDVGGESTRPAADPVPLQQEMDRVLPVLERPAWEGVAVSIDTLKPEVMRAAIAAGARVVNDVSGFRSRAAIEAVAAEDVGLVVMHMQGSPRSMQEAPRYDDVVAEVGAFLGERAGALAAAGVAPGRIAVDPGFGFGKSLAHNRALFRAIPALASMGYAVMAGVSRKRMIGDLTGRPLQERLVGSVAAAMLAVQAGARIVRVHDVNETVDALAVLRALGPSQEEA